jgi:hypothetical protein
MFLNPYEIYITKRGNKHIAFTRDEAEARAFAIGKARAGERVRINITDNFLPKNAVENEFGCYLYKPRVFCVLFGPAVRNPQEIF